MAGAKSDGEKLYLLMLFNIDNREGDVGKIEVFRNEINVSFKGGRLH